MIQIPPHLLPNRPTHILEIGVGRFGYGSSLWTPTIERLTLDSDQSYLGIDIGAVSLSGDHTEQEIAEYDAAMHAYWDSIRAARPNENIRFEQVDAREMSYADETFDRVVACNLYGGGALTDALVAIYRQSDRVLTPGGELVIYDDLVPYFTTRATLVNWFTGNGFSLTGEARRLPPLLGTYARYGLPTYNPDDTSGRGDVIRDRFEQSTLWVLGKSAFTQTIEPPTV